MALQGGLLVKLDVTPKGAMRSVCVQSLCSTNVKGELRVETNCADVRVVPQGPETALMAIPWDKQSFLKGLESWNTVGMEAQANGLETA